MNDSIPFVAVGNGEDPPWIDLDLNCPTCGEGPLPLQDSEPAGLTFIAHCDSAWLRGPIRLNTEGTADD